MNEPVRTAPYSQEKKEPKTAGEVLQRGHFFSFEGIDFCGKSTQRDKLEQYLKEQSIPVAVGIEPGTTSLGQVLRRILKEPTRIYRMYNREYRFDDDYQRISQEELRAPESEMLLFLAARREFVAHVVKPHLERGTTVIADRFADSTRAYQGGGRFGHEKAMVDLIDQLNNHVVDGIWPDKTFFLDIPYEEMLRRASANGKKLDFIESSGEAFFQRIIDEYRKIAAENPRRMVLIDGSQDQGSIFNNQILPQVIPFYQQLSRERTRQ